MNESMPNSNPEALSTAQTSEMKPEAMFDASSTMETPMTSEGFGLSSEISSHVAEPSTASVRGSFESAVSGFKFEGLRDRSLELASSLEAQAKANPLLAVGLVGVGALAAGFVLGRLLRPSTASRSIEGEQRLHHLDPSFARAAQAPERFSAYTD